MRLSEYLQKPRNERTQHINLSDECILIKRRQWAFRKSELLEFFELDDDIGFWRGTVCRCHLCPHDTQGTEVVCINPLHLYFGSPRENGADRPLEKRRQGGLAQRGSTRGMEFRTKNRERLNQPVMATNQETNEVSYFESAKQASELLGISRSGISLACKTLKPIKGFRFAKSLG